jgi:hypothetical protein
MKIEIHTLEKAFDLIVWLSFPGELFGKQRWTWLTYSSSSIDLKQIIHSFFSWLFWIVDDEQI